MTNSSSPRREFRYSEQFPENVADARRIIPILMEMIVPPRRVVDLGGGTGSWCKVFKELGAEKVCCIDDPRIRDQDLLVKAHEFIRCELSKNLPPPVPCDLAVCMEVVEHLPESCSDAVVEFLTRCAPLVLFSAAIPGQPEKRHINEKSHAWWREIFERRGFRRLDIIRPRIIGNPDIAYWYRQNLFLYAGAAGMPNVRVSRSDYAEIPPDFELVHERVLNVYRAPAESPKLTDLLRDFKRAIVQSLSYRIQRIKPAPYRRSDETH